MLFNSFSFLIFFPIVTALYFLLPTRRRWLLLLVSSCIFYCFFIPKYLSILVFTIIVDYFAGILIERAQGQRRKWLLAVSIAANVGVLAAFKYLNFFINNADALAQFIGWHYSIRTLDIILPIGLSFHTFQAMSYTIEVYRGRQQAERHFGIYALYVMFYPQLVAGPIERPQNLLHQFREIHTFEYARVASGLRLMAWGLFKKAVVADSLAVLANLVYSDVSRYSGPVLSLATACFAFQIFCDFSGYSDVAIGAARVMGFRLMRNFDKPYYARDIAEFWRRWHISLSTWFRDYLYIPLGGNRLARWRWYLNLAVVFLVSGLWHGANWTFIVWGGLHGCYLIFSQITKPVRMKLVQVSGLARFPRFHQCLSTCVTFLLICISWIFFRATSLHDAYTVIRNLCSGWVTMIPQIIGITHQSWRALTIGVGGMLAIELVHQVQQREAISIIFNRQPRWVRWSLYYATCMALFFLHAPEGDKFIYFQF